MKKIFFGKPKTLRKGKHEYNYTGVSLDCDNKECKMEENTVGICDVNSYKQREIVNQIYLGVEIEKHKKLISELKKKINSYKTQDEKKDRYEPNTFITEEELHEKLVSSKLKCHYCRNDVKVIYTVVRDDLQWTLDRIDNSIGHSSENTVISCLKCNLDRRVTDAKKFEFTKKLRIKKKNNL
mgnify:CR=1 FL=1|tara:strand:+ start:2375 stop:2920 length:546 start_codon:yes stop_codon:yes gene_type:complete